MRITLLLLLVGLSQQLIAQTTVKYFSGGPVLSAEYNLYHRYERPRGHEIAIASGGNRSVGQVANVLPGARIGTLLTFEIEKLEGPVGRKLAYRSYFHLLFEAGVSYMPFSFDSQERKGRGALGFPFMATALIPLGYSGAVTLGLGVQLSRIEMHKRVTPYNEMSNPFFHTYVFELGFIPHNIDMGYSFFGAVSLFIRGGLNEDLATTLDVGLRGTIGAGY